LKNGLIVTIAPGLPNTSSKIFGIFGHFGKCLEFLEFLEFLTTKCLLPAALSEAEGLRHWNDNKKAAVKLNHIL
jgi:hypothetical protein